MDPFPKLRALLQSLPMSPGVLFRYGESILPVRGKAAWEWYQRITRAQEQSSTHAGKVAGFSSDNATELHICEAMKAADMVYDAADDDPDLVPVAIRMRFQPQISRLELKSRQPLRDFSLMRARRVLIVSGGKPATPLVEAALESGLGNVVVCVPGDHAAAIRTAGEVRGPAGEVVEVITYDACLKALTGDHKVDYILAAAHAGPDWRLLEQHLEPLLSVPGAIAHIACVGAARVVVGTLDVSGCGGCISCLEAYCAERCSCRDNGAGPSGDADDIAVGARLAVQHLWDVATELPGEDTRHRIFDFDMSSCTLQRRPRPVGLVNCPRCRAPRLSGTNQWPSEEMAGPQLSFRELCHRAERLYVDNRTGLIAELEEGDLLQYPLYQCAALLNRNFCSSTFGWITDCGDDILMARVNAVRRTLELLCEDILRQKPARETPLFYYSAELELLGSRRTPAPTGVVVSALRPEDLRAEAFYRAVAYYAHSLRSWVQVEFEAIRSASAAEILSEHLRETGVFRRVRVQEFLLKAKGCRVLRFLYDANVVSVVAAPHFESAWETGLRDVWLHASALEAIPDRTIDTSVRFRAGSLPPLDVLSGQIRSLERALGRSFVLAPLVDKQTITALPLYLASASLVCPEPQVGENGWSRRNSTRLLVPGRAIRSTGLPVHPAQFPRRRRTQQRIVP